MEPWIDQVYIIEVRGERQIAMKNDGDNWTSLGSDYPDINDWGHPRPKVKILARINLRKLTLERIE